MKILFSFATMAVVALAATSRASGVVEWVARADAPGASDTAFKVLRDSGGNLYSAGTSELGTGESQIQISKVSPIGIVLWTHTIHGSAQSGDYGGYLALDPNENIILGGAVENLGTNGDLIVIKYDPNGNVIWSKSIDENNGNDFMYGFDTDSSGNIYLSAILATTGEWAVYKLDGFGNISWSKKVANSNCGSLKVDKNGNIHAVGEISGSFAYQKFSPSGQLLATVKVPSNGDGLAYGVDVDSQGNAYACGEIRSQVGNTDCMTAKISAAGNLAWSQSFDAGSNSVDYGFVVAVDKNGNPTVIGQGAFYPTIPGFQMMTLRYDTNGNLLWARAFDDRYFYGGNSAEDVALEPSGNAFVTGFIYRGPLHGFDCVVLKYDVNGNIIWQDLYDGPGHGEDFGTALCLDGSDGVYVGGGTADVGAYPQLTIIKYREGVDLTPTSFTVFRGTKENGGIGELASSDDTYLVVRNGQTINKSESPITVRFFTTAPSTNPSLLQLTIENRLSLSGLTQRIDLFDYQANTFVQLDQRSAKLKDNVVTVTAPNPSRFVKPGTLEVQAQLRIRADGPVSSVTWRSSIDQVKWFFGN